MKLYSQQEEPVSIATLESIIPELLVSSNKLDSYISSLEDHTKAYNSLNVVYDHVASEHFNFIDKGNYILYNEYIQLITNNLGVKPVVISQEAIETIPGVVLNHHISLEGLIGDLWAKIKALFTKIYESIKAFFKTYFTKLGRIKNKLNNIVKVLEETDKDIKTLSLDSVPSGLGSKYPFNGTININLVNEILNTTELVSGILLSINTNAKKLASKEVLDADFVANIKNLKDKAKDAGTNIDENNAKKGLNPFSANNKEIRADNKNLKQIKEESEKSADEQEGAAVDIGNSSDNKGAEIDDKAFEQVKKEFNEFIATVEKDLNTIKGKKLVNGNTITEITVKPDEGITLDINKDKETPSGVTLEGKSALLKLIKSTIAILDSTEKISANYSEINDTIMKNMDTVDKIVKDIDGLNMASLGKYKTVLTNKVRERLTLMKSFFSNYNKVNKTFFQVVMDTSEGNSIYALLSIKHFG